VYGIVDPTTGSEVNIEEEDIYDEIIQKMLDAGVEVIQYDPVSWDIIRKWGIESPMDSE
jgi:hypothetical protein